MATRTILVVDDDPKMRRLLRRCFEAEGFAVTEANAEADVLAAIRDHRVDMVTLDIGLGSESGLTIARDIRKFSDVPIMMVTARDDVIDKVVGLEIGADDYITKPFHVRELTARVHALLRRAKDPAVLPDQPGPGAPKAGFYKVDGLEFDAGSLELRDQGGQPVELTTADIRLFRVFLDNPKRALSRDQIMTLLNGTDWSPLDRTIDNQVARLRKKIERDPKRPTLIKTVRGIGYVLAADVVKTAA